MISLGLKQGDRVDVYGPFKRCIETSYGPQIAAQADATLRAFQQARDEVLQGYTYRNDPAALDKVLAGSKYYLSVWATLCQSFTIGREQVLINTK